MATDGVERVTFAPSSNPGTDVHVRVEDWKTIFEFEARDPQLVLSEYNASEVTVRINSHAVGRHPLDPFGTTVDGEVLFSGAGSSGLMIQAVFREHVSADVARSSFVSLLAEIAAKHYVEAPLLGSISSHRLHRLIKFNEKTRLARFMLPLEGTYSLWSAQQFRLWRNDSMLVDADWSTWLLGTPPASLGQAQALMRNSGVVIQPTVSAPQYSQVWLDWRCSDNDCSSMRFHKGIQYSVHVYPGESQDYRVPLQKLLPQHAMVQPGPLTSKSYLQTLQGASLEPLETDKPGIYNIPEEGLDLEKVDLTFESGRAEVTEPIWTLQTRLLRQAGQANGGTFELLLRNRDPSYPITVDIEQLIPAVLTPVWQSLEVVCDGAVTPWRYLHEPAIKFGQDGTIELSLTQRAVHREIRLILDYKPAFLSVSDFPGDANRGFEIPPATANIHNSTASLYSNAHLILAPLPDMSMPFNVISLTCTLYAFLIGSMLNWMIRKASKHIHDQLDPENAEPDTLLGRILSRLKKVVVMLKKKAAGPASVPKEDAIEDKGDNEPPERPAEEPANID